MIFKFLRQYFRDEELEQTKSWLMEAKHQLVEYRESLLKQSEDEKNKIDLNFLTLIWVSVGAVLALAENVADNLPKGGITSLSTPAEIAWFVLASVALVFILSNTIFALRLTLNYAKSKPDPGYKGFAYSLITVIAVIIICLIVVVTRGGL
jgi:hypothetical protein